MSSSSARLSAESASIISSRSITSACLSWPFSSSPLSESMSASSSAHSSINSRRFSKEKKEKKKCNETQKRE